MPPKPLRLPVALIRYWDAKVIPSRALWDLVWVPWLTRQVTLLLSSPTTLTVTPLLRHTQTAGKVIYLQPGKAARGQGGARGWRRNPEGAGEAARAGRLESDGAGER